MTDTSLSSSRVARIAAMRSARYASSRSSTMTTSFEIQRPPVVLELSSTIARVGYCDEFVPKHTIMFEAPSGSTNRSESEWYLYLSPIISQVYDRLMIRPQTRRVVILHAPYPPRTWERALRQTLWNRGVPAVIMVSVLDVVPLALGWHRGISVHVSRDEAVCVAHVDGHELSGTFQSVPCGYKHAFKDENKIECQWSSRMETLYADACNPSSLLSAMLKSLESCPRDVRKEVVNNMCFSGDALILIPDIGRRLAMSLRKTLDQSLGDRQEEEAHGGLEDDPALVTIVPIQKDTLKPLSSHIGLVPTDPFRPDHVPFAGASLWANAWYSQDDNTSRMEWIFAPDDILPVG